MRLRPHQYLLFLFFCLIACPSWGQDYLQFEQVHDKHSTISFCSFAQECNGLIWAGGEDGLYSYDGYNFMKHFESNTPENSRINAMQHDKGNRLYLGTDAGLLIFNTRHYRYEASTISFPPNIRALALADSSLWIGSLDGLFRFDIAQQKLMQFKTSDYPLLKNTTIYSFCMLDERLYIGTYNGLYAYNSTADVFQKIALPATSSKDNLFINSLLYDEAQGCLWVGTEGSLLKYNLADETTEPLASTQNNSIKTLSLGMAGELYIGTDFGLYTYHLGKLNHYQHDSRDNSSLVNNIIWSLFADNSGNIWIGTDNGISLLKRNELIRNYPLYNLTGTSSGNLLHCIFRDSRGFYWLGGSNGIIRMQRQDGQLINPRWYKVNDPQHPLAHGRIRDIFEDHKKSLWIATDGSLNKYDYHTEQFQQFVISDESGTLNANWSYNIVEDAQHRLWVSTCLGGIFVLSEEELARPDRKIKAAHNLNTSNGLSDMFIKSMLLAGDGKVWALSYRNTLDWIDEDLHVSTIDTVNVYNKSYLNVSNEGALWMSYDHGLIRIEPNTNQIDTVEFSSPSQLEVTAMEDVGTDIWVATSNGIWVVDKTSKVVQSANLEIDKVLSMYWDEENDELLLGRIDGLSIVKPQERDTISNTIQIDCSQIVVNDQILFQGKQSNNPFELHHQQNDLSFYLTDYPHTSSQKQHLLYQMVGLDDSWHSLSNQQNALHFKNLAHGQYQLQLAYLDKHGEVSDPVRTIAFRITPPWHHSWWAYLLYACFALGAAFWVAIYLRMKNKLHIERINRQQAIAQSKEKVVFLQQISQKIFEPLSNILLPISGLSYDKPTDQPLAEAVENLVRINRLTNEIARFDGNGTGNKELIISRFDLIKTIELLVFQQHISNISFSANVRMLIVELDRVKFESMFINLLLNAIRFGGNNPIQVLLNYDDNSTQLKLQVVDKGVGIAAEDMPYVFQKYYKSGSLSMQGTGMGLYFAKAYADQLGATISLSSNEGEGTVANIALDMSPFLVNVEPSNDSSFVSEEDFELKSEANMSNADIEFLAHITAIIEAEIDDSGLNVTELCERHHINYKQFYRRLKLLTNSTPSDFIRSIRMKKAALLLQQQEFNISEVMYMVGFSNTSYFSKCFKSEFGFTPMQYREHLAQ